MKIIRGAIDVKENTKEAILNSTTTLINAIMEKNNLDISDILAIFFSSTKDLNKVYPARAARALGINKASLMCFQEMDVIGSMERVIRLAMFVEKDIETWHIYLGEARKLRPDLTRFQIAVDGPAGSGKSTVSKIVARRLGILYIDTGAMYRAITLKALRDSINIDDEEAISNLCEKLDIDFRDNSIFLNGENVDREIRENIVSQNVSQVSSYRLIRERMVALQRKLAEEHFVIMDGRDIGTVVFPQAKYKFYLDAPLEIRAKRRLKELKDDLSLDEMIEEIKARDKLDMEKEIGPLKKAEDAIIIETENLGIEEVVEEIIKRVRDAL